MSQLDKERTKISSKTLSFDAKKSTVSRRCPKPKLKNYYEKN
jgi:hypothetical protein